MPASPPSAPPRRRPSPRHASRVVGVRREREHRRAVLGAQRLGRGLRALRVACRDRDAGRPPPRAHGQSPGPCPGSRPRRGTPCPSRRDPWCLPPESRYVGTMFVAEPYPEVLPGPVPESAPPRRPGSVRRTSSLDVTRGDGDGFLGAAAISGRGRDLLTGIDGRASVLDEASPGGHHRRRRHDRVGRAGSRRAELPRARRARSGFAMRSGIKDLLRALGRHAARQHGRRSSRRAGPRRVRRAARACAARSPRAHATRPEPGRCQPAPTARPRSTCRPTCARAGDRAARR